ncbi:MAG TPA: hemerythrin domain-containing protein [Ginsengibacter sp.]|nr:hemerythrin domain-containing protein [Ginsengibacter sp.]
MNTIPFTETESAVANERHYDLEILKNKGIDLNQIKTEITGENSNESVKSVLQPFKVFKPTSGNGFGKGQTDFLIDYIIKTHHEFAKKSAAVIYNLAQKVTYRHCDNHPELLTLNKIIFLFLHDLLNQMKEEEQFIFPRLRQKANAIKYTIINDTCISQSLEGEIKVLQNEHAKSLMYLKTLRQVTNNFGTPSDACNSYKTLFEKIKELEDDLNIHFHLEDDFLFSNALLLTEYD